MSPERLEGIIKEGGDILWYLCALFTDLGIPMSQVLETNVRKLQERRNNGVIHGDGDNR